MYIVDSEREGEEKGNIWSRGSENLFKKRKERGKEKENKGNAGDKSGYDAVALWTS